MNKFSRLGIFALTMAITILLILPAAQAVDFKISGQINRAVLYGDNGTQSIGRLDVDLLRRFTMQSAIALEILILRTKLLSF